MALPQIKSNTQQSQNTYQYQVRNAKKVERKGLNTDFQYLNNPEFTEASNDDRLLSSGNPTLRAQNERVAKTPTNEPIYKEQKPARELPRVRNPLNKKGKIWRSTKKIARRTKATLVSGSIVAWGMTLWTVQAVFALLSIAALGILGLGDVAVGSSLVTRIGGWAVERATEAATWFISGTAISLSDMGAGVYVAFYMLAFAIGVITLFAASIQYIMALVHPLSGDELGTKYVAFLLAIIGYATPIVNIFPWFLIFIFVVWKYPK